MRLATQSGLTTSRHRRRENCRRLRAVGDETRGGFAWKVLVAALPLALLGPASPAQLAWPDNLALPATNTAHSVSGQFTIRGLPATGRNFGAPDLATNASFLKLEPALAAVACERIKRALADVLGDRTAWQSKISLAQFPARSPDDEITIVTERFRDGRSYRLELPNPVQRTRFARAIVQMLLLERVGRKGGDRTAEIPEWLAAGLTQHLLMSDEGDLLPPPARWTVNGVMITPVMVGAGRKGALRRDPLEHARRTLRDRPPMTLDELAWPAPEQLSGAAGDAYRCSAQLFVAELLRLDNGRSGLCAMLDELGGVYNWQTAFFNAFQPRFERPVDLEKWWALQVAHFTGRDPAQTWSLAESWNKLDELLRTPVDVRRARDELPGHAEISLATVFREWDFVRQSQTLRAKLNELDLLRLRVSHDLVGLVDDYRRLLSGYLEQRDRVGLLLPGSKIQSPGANNILRGTLKELATLETRRAELHQKAVAEASTGGEIPWMAGP